MIGDLHCHSKLSDGSTGLEDIVFYSRRSGLDFISITDHDTMSGVSRALILGKRYGINIIPGVEISSYDPKTSRQVHILCYLPQIPDRIIGMLTRTLEARKRAGMIMLEKVMHFYPITEEHVGRYSNASKSIYKVHIMQALLDLGYDSKIYGNIYNSLFGNEARSSCYESVKYPTVEEVLNLIHQAKGIAVVAHPSVYKSMDLVEELAISGLIHGVEVYHPRNSSEDKEKLLQLSKKYALIITGGTDFHGFYSSGMANPIGTCITDEENIKKLYSLSKSLE